MKKTILIPTDFSIESLNIVKSVLNKSNSEDVFNIILLHGTFLTSSITELLFYKRTEVVEKLSNPEFDEACVIIKNKYASQINSIRKDLFTGNNQAAFNNYLEANNVEEAYIAANYTLQLHDNSFDLLPYIQKSSLLVDQVEWKLDNRIPEKGKLAEVFVNHMATS